MASSTTSEQYSCFFESTVWDQSPNVNDITIREGVEECMAHDDESPKSLSVQDQNAQTVDMVLDEKQRTVEGKEQTVDMEPTSMTRDETDIFVDSDNDVWSVVSDSDSIAIDEDQGLLSGDDEVDDEQELEEVNKDADAHKDKHPFYITDEDLGGCADNAADKESEVDDSDDAAVVHQGEDLDSEIEEEDLYICTDDEESLDETLIHTDENQQHLDDCTEEGIRISDIKEALQVCRREAWESECDLEKRHREELDGLQREHDQECEQLTEALHVKEEQVKMCRTEVYRRRAIEVVFCEKLEWIKREHIVQCNRERETADIAAEELKATQKKLEDCRRDFCTRLYAAERVHRGKLAKMQDKHGQELEELERKQRQSYEELVRTAKETEDSCHQKAARDAELMAKASLVLSAQIEKNGTMKAEFEKKLGAADSRYNQELRRSHAEREWLINKACAVLKKTHKVNDENLTLRKELTEVVDDIQELKQNEQTIKAEHNQEIARLKEEAQLQHEEAFDELVDEHEQDCAELADYLWEAENEIDELRQKEQYMISEHKKEMGQAKADHLLLENKVRDLLAKVAGVKQEGDELRDQVKEANLQVQEGKKREEELISQQGTDRAMFERSLCAMRNLLQDVE
ncbi:hypothetical protein QM012_007515 [Aureobasidium pullulans]|uniref:Uncharacterized protein n=1 Tax=Aureobasidium pullulans TaxID=5580 RepID=A0ABR0TN54_AURPU